MIKKQFRNRAFACLNSEMVGGFPPYTIEGVAVPEHSICEVMDDDTLRVVAVYKLHANQWYRYDLVSVWPPYPPQPEPLQKTISLGLVVPGMPVIPNTTGGGTPLYQNWQDGYPDSPVTTELFPFQCIAYLPAPDNKYGLFVSAGSFSAGGTNVITSPDVPVYVYYRSGASWVSWFNWTGPNTFRRTFLQSNFDIPAVTGGIYFAKTSPPASQPNPNATVLAPTPVSISRPALAVPAMPTITESTT